MTGTRSGRPNRRSAARAVAGPSTRRKAAGSRYVDALEAVACEALDNFPAPSDDAMLRKNLMTGLLTFPEAAALDSRELEIALDRVIKEYNPSTATPTAQGMVRFDDDRISAAFNLGNWFKIPTTEDLPPTVVTPGWLDERRRQLDEEVQPEKRDEPHSTRLLLAKMRVDLLTKGYVELPELYLDFPTDSPPKRITGFAASDDEQCRVDEAAAQRMIS